MKKTILITCIALILVLLGGILFLALFQKDFSYDFKMPNLIFVNKDNKGNNTAEIGSTLDPNKIFDELTNHSKKSIMQEAFNKSQIKYPSIKKNPLRKFTSTEKYVVTLRYGEEQTLTLDGKNYVDPNNSAINEIKYKELRFELGETNKDIMLKVYVMDLEETEKYYYVISQFGDYSNLYSYLSSIENLA